MWFIAADWRAKKPTLGKTKIYFDTTLQLPLVFIPPRWLMGGIKRKAHSLNGKPHWSIWFKQVLTQEGESAGWDGEDWSSAYNWVVPFQCCREKSEGDVREESGLHWGEFCTGGCTLPLGIHLNTCWYPDLPHERYWCMRGQGKKIQVLIWVGLLF